MNKIESSQLANGLNKMFTEAILPTVKSLEELLLYTTFMKAFKHGRTHLKDEFMTFGHDEKGYPMVYLVLKTGQCQENIPPNANELNPPFLLLGYKDGKRIWTLPYSDADSYALNEIVPRFYEIEHNLVPYFEGNTLTLGDVFEYEDTYYKVNVNSIKVSSYVIPTDPKQTQYSPINGHIKDDNTFIEHLYRYWKSKRDDNRFEPTTGSPVWEEVLN